MVRRNNQMERTRSAIVAAACHLTHSGAEVTMPAVAAAAQVSEATAYRYFPDLISLLREAVAVEDPVVQLQDATEGCADPVERVGRAAEILGRAVLHREGAVRAVVAAAIAKPERSGERPVQRFRLIEHALAPWTAAQGPDRGADVEQLVRDLALVISAESLFALLDHCGLAPDAAVASMATTARRLTAAALRTS